MLKMTTSGTGDNASAETLCPGQDDGAPTSRDARIGRPLALSPEDRRMALVRAAGQVFRRDGFSGATMQKIAAEAGMSKRTLYRIFPDKRAAFEALLGVQQHGTPLSPYGYRPGDDPRAELQRSLFSLTRYILSPKRITLTRLVIADSQQHPELSESFHRLEVAALIAQSTERFKRLRADGAILTDQAVDLSRLMIGAIIGFRQVAAMSTHPTPEQDPDDLAARVAQVIEIFAPALGLSPR
ncbi:TetR family transcriptional regulator [Pseudooceanicola spongiae]|uniref:TetR family transcriptional regulator n=2 Tax=Pseudooceanicola spongiae TaxID=2613965 RepID=A0A7L9WGN6_9RHOB|nr:TetR family transcriptional regulator [Pseudooceanicola spongiae]